MALHCQYQAARTALIWFVCCSDSSCEALLTAASPETTPDPATACGIGVIALVCTRVLLTNGSC